MDIANRNVNNKRIVADSISTDRNLKTVAIFLLA